MENTRLRIKIIIGSTRSNRFSEKPAQWIYEEAKKKADVSVELLDLRDYPMPFLEPRVPAARESEHANGIIKTWSQKIKDGDAFIIVTPEYNYGYPAVLKNALDSVFQEWNKKPVGFISYGRTGGFHSVEQLKQVVTQLQMVPIKNAINISDQMYRALTKEQVPVNPEIFRMLRDPVLVFLNELIQTAKELKTTRGE